jgi:alkylation response protein AidB-like acyl-CoA dehydrogenase
MDFELSAEQKQLQNAARAFAKAKLQPLVAEIEATSSPVSMSLLREFAEMGFLGINMSPEFGGAGLGNLEALIVVEELAKIHLALAFPVFESCVGPVRAIEHFGQESLKRRVVPAVCRGELIVAAAMSEPNAGTALTDLQTRGEVADDHVAITGAKRWCSGGGHAGGYLVYCRLSKAPRAKGIGAVYVEKDRPGVSYGTREQLMGFRGVSTADIYFDNVRVPLDQIVMPAGGFGRLMTSFDLERCGNATMCLGIATAAFDEVLEYVQQRKQFGKPLIEFQAVQLKIAEIAVQVEAARLLIYKAATGTRTGFPLALDASLAKCYANEMVRDVCAKALQLMGAYGYSKQFAMEQRFRDGWGWGIAGGAIDIQKVNIASALAGRRFAQRD